MLVKTFCAAVMGLEATTITIEVNMTRGVQFRLSGLADTAVKESYDRIRAAMGNIGFKPPTADITINLSPADIRKEGSGYDLPLAVGILAAHGKISDTCLSEYMMVRCPSPLGRGQRSLRVSSFPRKMPVRLLS